MSMLYYLQLNSLQNKYIFKSFLYIALAKIKNRLS